MKIENGECIKVNANSANVCDVRGRNFSLDDGFRFTVSLVTTVGYGDLTPMTNNGRIVTLFVGGFGIPLAFAAFLKGGKVLAYFVLCFYTQILACGLCKRDKDDEEVEMNGLNTIGRASIYSRQVSKVEVKKAERGRFGAVVIGIMIFIGYIVGTSFLIRDVFEFEENGQKMELTFVDALYFNFGTISTIGFGDLVPKYDGIFQVEDMKLFVRSIVYYLYLSVGITLLFMNIVLARMEVNRLWFVIKTKLSIV